MAAPPAIISIFLGDELEATVRSLADGHGYSEQSKKKYMSFGISTLPSIRRDNTDRNRTSPFAFTGNKFEFRMVGSSQNIALSNIVLNTAVAKSFSDFADELEGATDFESALDSLIATTFKNHLRILFSGNSYSAEWEREAKSRGLSNFKTSPEAYSHFTDDKNIELFSKFGVMSETEMRSRREIFFESYRKIKNIEARTMLEMTIRDIIPAVSSYIGKLSESINALKSAIPTASLSCETAIADKLSELLGRTYEAYSNLLRVENIAVGKSCDEEAANYYKSSVLPKMSELRRLVDEMETLTAREFWPMPTYGDLTFSV